jgi:aspartate kinase
LSVRPIVIKFGGATLGREDRVRRTERLVQTTTGPLLIVVSAREGVTNRLKNAIDRASRNETSPDLESFLKRFHPGISDVLSSNLRDLDQELGRIRRARTALPDVTDAILARGERLSAHWYAHRLAEIGLPAVAVEADRLGLQTDGNHGAAVIQQSASQANVRRGIASIFRRRSLPIVTGYIGRTIDGHTTTLGRGGSDYTATSLGSIVGAERTILVKTDVSLFTADPRIVRRAQPVARLSYEEAEELAQFGAKVLHPLTVEPARVRGMEVTVESLERPGLSTTIGPEVKGHGIRAMTLLSPVALLHVRVPGGRQRKGVIAEVARILASARVNVVTLFTSSALLSIVVEAAMGKAARQAITPFVVKDGLGASLDGPRRSTLVTVIGEGVGADIGRIPREITEQTLGISGTTRTLSLAVPIAEGRRTLRELHRVLVEEPSHLSPR